MSESKGRQTHSTGDVYTHPRGKKYRDEFDRIFGKDKCCGKDYEDCKCNGENSSDA